MLRSPGRYLSTLVVLAVVAMALVGIPGTDAVRQPRRLSASQLPALRSAEARAVRPLVGVGRSSASVHGTRGVASTARFDAFGFHAMDVNNPPPATTASAPDDGAAVTTMTPTLSVAAVTDPEADAVSYRFKVTTKSDAETGSIVADTAVTSTSFTVPDGGLKDGVTYFWHTYTVDASHPSGTAPGWVRSFRVDLRLGQRSTFPFDSEGPGSVNLANGNLVLGASSASVGSLSGPVGVGFVYNSLAPSQPGLIGSYTVDADGDHEWDTGENPSVVRRDPTIAFDWGTGAPAPGMTATNTLARWVGYVTAPTTGSYKFGATTSDGVRITVGSTTALGSWVTQSAGAPIYDQAVSLTGGAPTPITVEWFKGATAGSVLKLYVKGSGGTSLAEQLVDPSWLSSEAGALSKGWTLSPLGGGLSYVRAEVSDGKVVFIGPDGDTHVYTSTGSGYTPPKDEDGILARDSNGLLTLDSSDGTTYVFDAAGVLVSATSSSGAKPASLRYTWSTPSGLLLPRLTGITDPVSARTVTLRYGGDSSCPLGSEADPTHVPSGFDAAAPNGSLCSVVLWDGRVTRLWYYGGQLARIENPGSEVTDFAYDSNGRISKVRDPLAADLVAGGRADDNTTRTLIGYDSNGRVESVTLGEPTASAARPKHTYRYVSGTEVQVDLAGVTASWWRKVTMDANGRQLTDTDATNRTTTYVWDAADRVVSTTDPAGLRSTTIFDWVGRPIESYGPAPSAWFGTDNKPLTAYVSQVAKSTTNYDENLKGLDALYFNNRAFAGEPVGHQLFGDSTGALNGSWSTLPTGVTSSEWSARFTGELAMDYVGSYTISPNVAGKARIYLDDVLVLDTASGPTATYSNTAARHRLRVEYTNVGPTWQTFSYTGSASSWTVPAGVTSVTAEAWGGEGGAGAIYSGTTGGVGGLGGYAKATLAVTPAETLSVRVGGQGATTNPGFPSTGGFNGGGDGNSYTGGGGGASDVRRGGTTLADRVAVAGGGGGGGYGGFDFSESARVAANGGNGGGSTAGGGGTGGSSTWDCGVATGGTGGSGGTQAAGGGGGAGGVGTTGASTPLPGPDGTLGQGGSSPYAGGGGGGGSYGGGGGGGGGFGNCSWSYEAGSGAGGGGSNLVTGTPAASTGGVRSGNGQVQLSWQGALASAALDLHWTPPGGSDVRVPGTAFTPRYGLVTSSLDADGKKVATEYSDSTTTPPIDPSLGLATATVVDPAGLALRSTTSYEPTGTGFYRRTGRALPNAVNSGVASEKVAYVSYGGIEARTNPCPSGVSAVQAGLPKVTTEADPDGSGLGAAIQREVVYDDAGRIVASRVVSDDAAWACTTYDARGRATHQVDKAGGDTSSDFTTTPGTVTTTAPDSSGTSRTTVSVVDLLGRTVRYTDELATQTRAVYDQAGRLTDTYRTFAGGGSEQHLTNATYDEAGRVLTQSDFLSASARVATYTYDSVGRLATVARSNGIISASSYAADTGRLVGIDHGAASYVTQTQTFGYTGAAQSWTVPTGVSSVTVEAWGAQGGTGYSSAAGSGGTGGLGGYAKVTLAMSAGQTVGVNVGGPGAAGATVSGGGGGFNGGGIGPSQSGGGGGASDVRQGGSSLSNRVVVAGGGGGGGGVGYGLSATVPGGSGGGGGSSSGGSGQAGTGAADVCGGYAGGGGGGGGGTASAGGAGGSHGSYNYSTPNDGVPGGVGVGGGNGYGGAGGGGGYYGGGSGATAGITYCEPYYFWNGGAGGGGGGSNYVSGSGAVDTRGVRSGSGQVKLTWQTSSLPTATYAYSSGGRVTRETAGVAGGRQRDFTYDAAGRLTTTVEGAMTRTYTYDRNTNRCLTSSCTGNTAWTYDYADRITKSPYASAYAYDPHGNLTGTTGTSGNPSATIVYDARDHATVVEDGTTRVTETLAPSGRVLRRVVTTIATSTVTEDTSYGYAGPGDSPAYSKPTSGSTVTTYLTGMGGLVDVGGTATWSLYSAHGDVLGTTNAAGTYTAAPQADEFGLGTTPASRLGWLGQQQRPTVGVLGVFRMGVRLYDPALGRFLEVDPIEGGSANDYDYVNGDPVNGYDLDGRLGDSCSTSKNYSKCIADRKKHADESKGAIVRPIKEVIDNVKASVKYLTCVRGCTTPIQDPGVKQTVTAVGGAVTNCLTTSPSASSMAKDAVVNTAFGGATGGGGGAAIGLAVAPAQSQMRHCLG